MSIKNSIIVFSILFTMSCHSEKESSTDSRYDEIESEKESSRESKYLRWGDDIEFDPAVDDDGFKVCQGDEQVIQYFNNSQGVEYEGEKPAIDKAFQESYDASKAAKESGLNIAKALCYKALGQREKALEIFEDQLEKDEHSLGAFDYLHLRVLYFETGQWQKAIDAFQKQEEENNLAENHFYLALVYKELGQIDQYINHLEEAKALYTNRYHMFDPYNHLLDEIFLENIENEMKTAYNTH